LKVPAAQGAHTSEAAPTSTLPVPGGHSEHAEAPGAAAKEPAAQGTQAEMEAAPGSGLERPGGQGVQPSGEPAPAVAPYVPASQRKGCPPTQKEPAGHCWQDAAPAPE
jgi:hypothetical protein